MSPALAKPPAARGANWSFAAATSLVCLLQIGVSLSVVRGCVPACLQAALPGVDAGVGVVLGMVNAYFLFNLFTAGRRQGPRSVALYLLGYLGLFGILFSLLRTPLLFSLFLLVYAGLQHRPLLTGYLFIFVVCFFLLPPFSAPMFGLCALIYAGVTGILRRGDSAFLGLCFAFGALLLVALLLPVLHLCTQHSAQTLHFTLTGAPRGPGSESWEVRQALKASLLTASLSTLIVTVFGVPLAYAMTRAEFRGKGLIDLLIDLPILVPPLVVGMGLLLLLGPDSPLGSVMRRWLGTRIDGSLVGIVAAQVFVSSPFLVRSAMTAFDGIDPRLERVARTLGGTRRHVFAYVALPLAARGILRGGVLTWARSISEFGSLLVLAYRPFTAPTLIYDRFSERGLGESAPIAVLLVLMCTWVFAMVRFAPLRPFARLVGRPPHRDRP